MKKDRTLPGFSGRKQAKDALKKLYWQRFFFFGLPLFFLILIDVSKQGLLLAPLLIAIPFLDLRNQFNIWRKYLKHFGPPSRIQILEMWQLDSQRGYDPIHRNIENKNRGHILETSAALIGLAFIFILIWSLTGWVTMLYPSAVFVALSVKGLLRRARPPAVLFLGASSTESTQIQIEIWKAVYPLDVISCLHHQKTAVSLLDESLLFVSYRVSDESVWKEMVTPLMKLSKLVIIDLGNVTSSVEYEVNLALTTIQPENLFFIGNAADRPELPNERCFTEGEIIQHFQKKFTEHPKRILAGNNTFRDTKNHYFSFTPPPGWVRYDYSDPRTKVQFSHPNEPQVLIRLIVKGAANENFAAMLENDYRTARSVAAMGAKCSVQEGTFLGNLCSTVTTEYPNKMGYGILYKFFMDGLHFNIQFSAPDKITFNKYHAKVIHSLNTIVSNNPAPTSEEKITEQQIANRIRLAELMADSISLDEAQHILANAREKYPNNKLIQDTIEELKDF